ncbi:unnamed protein product [Parajaminaea phylloscopi]
MAAASSSSLTTLTPQLRKLVLQTFTKKYSLQLHASALTFIATTLADHELLHVDFQDAEDQQRQQEAIEVLAKGCLDLSVLEEADAGPGSIVTAKQLQHVYAQLVADGNTGSAVDRLGGAGDDSGHHHDSILDGEEVPPPDRWFDVIDAFEMPTVRWDAIAKTFVKSQDSPSILPPPLAKPLAVRNRLQALRALVLRNENFCPPLPGTVRSRGEADSWMKLTSTSNLLGRPNGRFLLFGLLTSTPDGRWCLEDEDGRVELDMSDTVPGEGIFTLGSLVLVEGRYSDEGGDNQKLYVHAIGHPPSEPRSRARELYGHIDWTGKGVISLKEERSLETSLQRHHNDVSFVTLSDLHLDVPRTFHSLRALIQGYIDADFVPFLFIFCGNFLSEAGRRKADGGLAKYNEGFSTLSDVLTSFPTLFTSSHFLFVPGPLDPYSTPVLPRKGLPTLLVDPFVSRLSAKLNVSSNRVRERVHFVSNPCRVRFWGREVVIFRDDMLDRMRRNGVAVGEGKDVREGGMKKFLVSTLLDQAHLSPLGQQARPVFWDHDHTLRLYPMPSALILADSSEHFELTYESCHVLNPGSFNAAAVSTYSGGSGAEDSVGISGAGWTTYYPASGRGERSELPRG